ncbi:MULTISPECIES: RNA polymerase sigma factor [Exiguobacterium]|uniref:RNA polymerase sigma factor n=1 Tax=Exiguobacterium TaxID=33986 RepID=UPI0004982439|nr:MULTISPECIES: sigma-70 family RNA polymerase sigma factor [Exiguobacterium]TCI69237.1 sigma-70 family RNA polymerase sigma factor [Exiguobacterium sp. IPCI3]TCI78697.1 sigma-70 family RNA polymerase sigma factor [Exiguobacterium sp. IPCH1]TCI81201.1 sigma-70 family RNA polymerase sigma factor [Exiguobacterium sp. IPBC4]
MTDIELYERVRQKDKQALEALYDRYERILYAFVMQLTKDRDLAEEAMQEVFIKLWRGGGVYDDSKGKFKSWLFTMSRHVTIDLIRKRKPDLQLDESYAEAIPAPAPSVETEVEWQEERTQIETAMAELPVEQQQVVRLMYFQGLSQQKIADACGIPLGTVKGRIRLALKQLRRHLSHDLIDKEVER